MFEVAGKIDRDALISGILERPVNTVYFCRIIGSTDNPAYVKWLQQLYIKANENGMYWTKPVPNPTEPEVTRFNAEVKSRYVFEEAQILRDVRASLPGIDLENARPLSQALTEMIGYLKGRGAAESILVNAYVKFLCWLRGRFENIAYQVGEAPLPLLLCEGTLGKYEVCLLHVLARAGCDVFYFDPCSEEAYLKADPQGEFSIPLYFENRGAPPIEFSQMDIAALKSAYSLRQKLETAGFAAETNTWLKEDWMESIFSTNEARGGFGGRINNFFIRYVGVDVPDAYRNRLYGLRKKLDDDKVPYVLVEQRIENPDMAEVAALGEISGTLKEDLILNLADKIVLEGSTEFNLRFQRAFWDTMLEETETNLTRLRNIGAQFVCWVRRYGRRLAETEHRDRTALMLYYGGCTAKERDFLCLLARAGVDVLVVTSDAQKDDIFYGSSAARLSRLERLPDAIPYEPFPKIETKVRVATTAYNAQRELNEVLYDGTGLFRSRQFVRSHPITLKTTYEEALQLWGQEAKYRPYFQAAGGRVDVPNLFMKVSGVKDGETGAYFNVIRGLLTENTVLITQIPIITASEENPVQYDMRRFFRNGKLLPDQIKAHPGYRYDYLNEDTQDYMLEKMQELMDLNWIQSNQEHLEYTILSVLLNLDRQFLRMIQNFDFTAEIPKLLIILNDETVFTLEDSIFILFLNLIGFDIAVFTPTGYRNLEKYIVRSAYEEYTIGAFQFNLAVPVLRPPRQKEGWGLVGKLFGKGRNG